MERKLDLSSAFERARELFMDNLQLLLAVAGVFFVIPQLIVGFITANGQQLDALLEDATKIEDFIEAFSVFYQQYSLWFILLVVVTFIGTLTILVILLDKTRPTVGQAIGIAFSLLLFYFLLSLLTGLATLIGLTLLILPGLYFALKFCLAAPIMVAEKVTNPIEAMKASWNLTKGNSIMIFVYLFIIGIVILVVSLLVEGIAGLLGETIGLVISALFGGVITAFNIAVTVGLYQELRGPMTEDLTDTFG
ncbi:glycerophosphoryl diester phosphodiesterase membrane domain-containing protein [Parasphingorhabdus sp. DH2-15]|uniref:glycerophosphoryl diester phosphodiesterase membrane domain-containing protein n=1 Tax=Parasphingorhabdus sp. DH2-15 TaxID=3444112 RepID=UPI003F685A29